MPREEQIGSHGLPILDFDLLADDLERLPAGLVAVFVSLGGIEFVNVEIVLVDGKIVIPKAIVPLWPMEIPGSAGSPAPITFRPGALRCVM